MSIHKLSRLRLLVVQAAAVAGLSLLAAAGHAGSSTNEYDSLGRLTKVTYSNGVVVTYVYDAAGNRTTYIVTGAPS